jgi:beta-mannanase/cellulose synthase/poly-beta-1,6-N-acetylglucosamine synthase-like glycosyltransferase
MWWLQPEHYVGAFGFVLSTTVLAWVTLLPSYFIVIFSRSRAVSQALEVPSGYRVAMVVTKVPTEPFSLVQQTLEAMLGQLYPHDTWLADEDPSQETIEWCERHKVNISSRKGSVDYHRTNWPRRAKCKEGNLAYFYDHYGYVNYDIVVQLDADHVPSDEYLEQMLRPFADPAVGYVSAPSICDRNAHKSWSARGRLYVEGALHGALQAGYNGGLAPLCIGSHYAVRTAALKEIGGLGPELAEDHSTTLLMNAHGWRGVHAISAIARGDGPETFSDMATQEFQWSRSLIMILLQYTPRYISSLPFRLKFQFLFSQLWYLCFSLMMLLMFILPIGALLADKPLVNIPYPYFFVYSSVLTFVLIVIAWRLRAFGVLRPCGVKILSWEGILFLFARWPWSLIGALIGVRDWFTGKVSTFRVTPKGAGPVASLPLRVLAPYIILSLVSSLAATLFEARNAPGYYIFALVNCTIYNMLLMVILIKHVRENAPLQKRPVENPLAACALIASALLMLPVSATRIPAGVQGILWTADSGLLPSHFAGMFQAVRTGPPQLSLIPDGSLKFGAYDPHHRFSNMPEIEIDHVFLQWNAFDRTSFQVTVDRAKKRHRMIFVTIEPFTKASDWRGGGAELFSEIVSGRYDGLIDRMCVALASSKAPAILIRWGHEMDDDSGRYPWARDDPRGYVAAYRHFVRKCRHYVPQAHYVWSPTGLRDVKDYYPGDSYVDFVGLSAYSLEAWDLDKLGRVSVARDAVRPRYDRVVQFQKPVIFAEIGVSGHSEYVRKWLLDLNTLAQALPLLRAIIYFNDKEPHNWGKYGSPDWRVTRDMLQALTKKQRGENSE